jgi:dihydroorotate dehydrogenase
VGGVTPLPQPGNPRRGLFRLDADRRDQPLGLNSEGVESSRRGLRRAAGGTASSAFNIGANKDTGDRAADYVPASSGSRA